MNIRDALVSRRIDFCNDAFQEVVMVIPTLPPSLWEASDDQITPGNPHPKLINHDNFDVLHRVLAVSKSIEVSIDYLVTIPLRSVNILVT